MILTAPWLQRPDLQALMGLFAQSGHEILVVGGAIRNTLLDRRVTDVDLASSAPPQEASAILAAGGLRVVETGLAHGTLTAITQDHSYEITSFRADIATDGRHAQVRFGHSLAEDAHRRDFTLNALYARADGTVLDPTGQGLDDLRDRHLRFIGEAAQRIAEDRLRILRYFRFFAEIGDPLTGFDPEALAACAQAADHITALSRERIGAEMRKLLTAPDPSFAVAGMAQTGILGAILAGADATPLAMLIHLETTLAPPPDPDPIRRLAALGGANPKDALRLSRQDSARWQILTQGIGALQPPSEMGYRLGFETARDIILLRAASFGTQIDQRDLDRAAHAAIQEFPIRGADLMPKFSGPALGAERARLETLWIASDFQLTRAQLLSL